MLAPNDINNWSIFLFDFLRLIGVRNSDEVDIVSKITFAQTSLESDPCIIFLVPVEERHVVGDTIDEILHVGVRVWESIREVILLQRILDLIHELHCVCVSAVS